MIAPLTSLQAPTGLGLSTLAAYEYLVVRRGLFVVAQAGRRLRGDRFGAASRPPSFRGDRIFARPPLPHERRRRAPILHRGGSDPIRVEHDGHRRIGRTWDRDLSDLGALLGLCTPRGNDVPRPRVRCTLPDLFVLADVARVSAGPQGDQGRSGVHREPGLPEVRIERYGLTNAEVLHEDEGGAVREGPAFVGSSDEELPRGREGG